MRRSLFEKYIPEVAQAIADILGVPKDKTEKPFYKALPNFVRFAETEAPSKEDKGSGSAPPPSIPPPADSTPPAPPRKESGSASAKGKNKTGKTRKGEQLSLVE